MIPSREILADHIHVGILKNISPLPTSSLDIDKDLVVPLLVPVISSVSLPEAAALAAHHTLNPVRDTTAVSRVLLSLIIIP